MKLWALLNVRLDLIFWRAYRQSLFLRILHALLWGFTLVVLTGAGAVFTGLAFWRFPLGLILGYSVVLASILVPTLVELMRKPRPHTGPGSGPGNGLDDDWFDQALVPAGPGPRPRSGQSEEPLPRHEPTQASKG
jgi:hypothetical protein